MVGIVVLNYVNYAETIRCVDSLLKQKGVQLEIVIVDNGSDNESMAILDEKYNLSSVKLISLKENIGFAKGMNAGIDVLRSNGINNIFICNSDLVFTTERIMHQIVTSDQYTDKRVAVINPLVLNVNGSKANRTYFKEKFLRARMLKTFFPIIEKIKTAYFKGKANTISSVDSDGIVKQRYSNKTVIHDKEYLVVGCGYLLTERFFQHYNGLFPKTFLYYEEYALILFLNACGLKTSFVETDVIEHKHGASTVKNKKNNFNKNSKKIILKLIATSPSAIIRKYGK